MGGMKKVMVVVLLALACAAWAKDRVSVPVLGEYTDTGSGHRMLYTGTVDFAWTPGAYGTGTAGWAFTGAIYLAVMDSSTGARFHYFGGCNDCVPLLEGERVDIERPVWLFGCSCAPRFTGVLALGLTVPPSAEYPAVETVAFVGR